MRPALGRVLINESWVSDGAPMSVLEPTPVANQRIWALPPVAMSRRSNRRLRPLANGRDRPKGIVPLTRMVAGWLGRCRLASASPSHDLSEQILPRARITPIHGVLD